ncbi:MAG: methyltransferase domain-containing protein [Scrofimicrobium sp.]
MGKKVLRPGGVELTNRILEEAAPSSADSIVEFGPGVGKTAQILLAVGPQRYWGVDIRDTDDNQLLDVLAGHPNAVLVNADARSTGLSDGCATLVVGEAMRTMQSDQHKLEIMKEAFRILAPGGRYAIHEMGFRPDTPVATSKAVEKALSRTIKVGARPLTLEGWTALLEEAGFEVRYSTTNKMALLEVRRMISDEGIVGFAKIVKNVAGNSAARERVLKMRKTFKANQEYLCAVGIVAMKP